MEGYVFFWLFWIYWIMVTFFMKKGKARLLFSILLLVTISCSIFTIRVYKMEISMAGLIILATSYYILGRQKRQALLYSSVTPFIMMIAYATFQLYELYDPVWVIFDRTLMLSTLLAYLAILLHHDLYQRVICVLAGSIHGDILYSLVLQKLTFSYSIGTFAFLDVAALSTAILLGIGGIKGISNFFEGYFKQVEKEKQKLS